MIGHGNISQDLKNCHVRNTLWHGYIFYGPAMVGKRLMAESFAHFLEKKDFDMSERGILSDMMLIQPGENGSIGIDAVREIRNFLWQKPNASSRRTLIIDDAELLTVEAQNALLKITEEPPSSSLLILITSDLQSILPTIASRLPKLYFGIVPEEEIMSWLVENGSATKEAAKLAKKAMGKPGLAWRLQNDAAFQKQLELAEKLLKAPPGSRRDLIKKIIEPDDFSFRKFLDAVIIILAWQKSDNGARLWHNALQLYDRETNFSLNPRLQLENLLAYI